VFQTKVAEKIKTHNLCSINYYQKSCHIWANVENCGRTRQAADDDVIWCMEYVLCVPDNWGNNTDTHLYYLIFIASSLNTSISLWSHKIFYSSTYKNWENVQWLACHYDLFSQIVYVKKAMSKQIFFCLNKDFIWIVLRACKLVGI